MCVDIGRSKVLQMNRLVDDDDASRDFAQGRLVQLSMGLGSISDNTSHHNTPGRGLGLD